VLLVMLEVLATQGILANEFQTIVIQSLAQQAVLEVLAMLAILASGFQTIVIQSLALLATRATLATQEVLAVLVCECLQSNFQSLEVLAVLSLETQEVLAAAGYANRQSSFLHLAVLAALCFLMAQIFFQSLASLAMCLYQIFHLSSMSQNLACEHFLSTNQLLKIPIPNY
jgi:hypothetical protein